MVNDKDEIIGRRYKEDSRLEWKIGFKGPALPKFGLGGFFISQITYKTHWVPWYRIRFPIGRFLKKREDGEIFVASFYQFRVHHDYDL